MNYATLSLRLKRTVTSLFAACLSCGSVAASTNHVGGGISLAYGPPLEVIQREFFNRGSSVSGVSGGAESVVGNEVYSQVGQVNARAGFGVVGVSASSHYDIKLPRYAYVGNVETVQASGTARAIFTDVLVTGPGSGRVSTRLRMHLDGVLSATSVPSTNIDRSVGSASISFGIYVNNDVVGWGNRFRSSNSGGAPETGADGLFSGFNGGVIVTPSFSVPLNTPVTVMLEMTATAKSRLDGSLDGTTSGSAQYYHSLGFAAGQPVFDLPAGYTANSPAGGIKNNFYIPPPADPPVLSIQAKANTVALSWPSDYPTALLESSTNILGAWTGIPTAPVQQDSRYVLTWTNDVGKVFFRLRVP